MKWLLLLCILEKKVTKQVVSHTSVHVDMGAKPNDNKAEPSMASTLPLQDEQEPSAYNQAPRVSL